MENADIRQRLLTNCISDFGDECIFELIELLKEMQLGSLKCIHATFLGYYLLITQEAVFIHYDEGVSFVAEEKYTHLELQNAVYSYCEQYEKDHGVDLIRIPPWFDFFRRIDSYAADGSIDCEWNETVKICRDGKALSQFLNAIRSLPVDQILSWERNLEKLILGGLGRFEQDLAGCILDARPYHSRIIERCPDGEVIHSITETWELFTSICSIRFETELLRATNSGEYELSELYQSFYYGYYGRIADIWNRVGKLIPAAKLSLEEAASVDYSDVFWPDGSDWKPSELRAQAEFLMNHAENTDNERIKRLYCRLADDAYRACAYKGIENLHWVSEPLSMFGGEDISNLSNVLNKRVSLGDYNFNYDEYELHIPSSEEIIMLMARGVPRAEIESKLEHYYSSNSLTNLPGKDELARRADAGDPLACSALAYDILYDAISTCKDRDDRYEGEAYKRVNARALDLFRQAADGGFANAGYPVWLFNWERTNILQAEDGTLTEPEARKYLFQAAATGDVVIPPVAVLMELVNEIDDVLDRQELSSFDALDPEMITWYCRLYHADRERRWIEQFRPMEEMPDNQRDEASGDIWSLRHCINDALYDSGYYYDGFLFRILKCRDELGITGCPEQDQYFEIYRASGDYQAAYSLASGSGCSSFCDWAELLIGDNSGEYNSGLYRLLDDIYSRWDNYGLYT